YMSLSTSSPAPILFADSPANDPVAVGGFAGWLAIELAPLICGSKPATILTFTNNRCRPLLALWQLFSTETQPLGPRIRHRILVSTATRETVLFYLPQRLEECLKDTAHYSLLAKLKYPLQDGLESCLDFLAHRFEHRCPHEIGLILGIPLKDVLGFMGLSPLPLTCRRTWCVYGDPSESLSRMKQHSHDRRRISFLLRQGAPPHSLIRGHLSPFSSVPAPALAYS
ncbi:MAG TPA: DUF3793 family protein, partial [Patescibacteria group bacterium]|nr:DUF3793 family protein [Patescibacteria group bacterium]